MKLKVCGMKLNTSEVAALRPDYLGFIFWEKSSRYFDGEIAVIPELPAGIEKIGVFVDAPIEEILQKTDIYHLQGIQLHGMESPRFCRQLGQELQTHRTKKNQSNGETTKIEAPLKIIIEAPLKIIKVFSIKDHFDFSTLEPYENVCDYYLFDTKGELPGGNGYAFDWSILANYPSTKPFFLSGGIGLEQARSIKEFKKQPAAKYCHAIDVNSRFEVEPGLKHIEDLNTFKMAIDNQ